MSQTNLKSKIEFSIVNMQGKSGFPEGPEGLVYEHDAVDMIPTSGGPPRVYESLYQIRADDKGWRIDHVPQIGPREAVYDPRSRVAYFSTPEGAAKALVAHLAIPYSKRR